MMKGTVEDATPKATRSVRACHSGLEFDISMIERCRHWTLELDLDGLKAVRII